jgi:hypothetical protein
MSPDTRAAVTQLIHAFMTKWLADAVPADELGEIARSGVSRSGLLAPFHDALVPGIGLLSERSFSTRLGNLHEAVAEAIGREQHLDARRAYDLSGSIPVLTREFITQRVLQLERRQVAPDAAYEREQIRMHFGDEVTAATRADLFIRTRAGEEHYFEIKSAKPNKGQCIEMKQRLMTAFAIRRAHNAFSWWGVPYNPYGRGTYRHAYALPFFDFDSDAMLGPVFWDFVGGAGTYDELLALYVEVGRAFAAELAELRGM